MRLKTQRTYLLFFLISTFLFVDAVESIAFAPEIGSLIKGRQIPLYLRRIIADKWNSGNWNKLKLLFKIVRKIGDTVDGLSDVKEYLEIFGYVKSPPSSSNFTDEFTVDLQSAIIKFQKNFNLRVTEQLDENTYQVISQPRCGVPDFINGTTTMNLDNVDSTTTSFKPWWRTGEKEKELTYAFHPKNNVTDGVKSLFQDVFNRWSNVTSLTFIETTSFNASDIKIAFVTIDGKGGTVGGSDTSYSAHFGIIYLDSEEQWVLPSEKLSEEGDVDLESVAMHQVGHVLGLGHSSMEEAVMYPIALPKKKTELANNDDLQRIQEIYDTNPNTSNHDLSSSNGRTNPNTSNHDLSSSNGRASNGVDPSCGWRRNIVLSLAGGFAFVVLGF